MGYTSAAIEDFLNQHRPQFLASHVPERYWESLYKKLFTLTFDAGNFFQLVKIDYEEEKQPYHSSWGLQALCDLQKNDSNTIFLIDHAWTFQINEARKHLEYDNLRLRIARIMDLNEDSPKEELIEEIFENMWRFNNSYAVRNLDGTEQTLMWFFMDEIGCAVQHSGGPNCRIVPFVHLNQGMYCLLFLQKDIKEGDLIFRDFAEGITDPLLRKATLLPWIPSSFDDIPTEPSIPGPEYYLAGHIPETLPDLNNLKAHLTRKEKYFVFTQYSFIKKFLTDSKFQLTENEDEADVLWFTEHFRDFKSLSESPGKFVNQFPYEYVLTIKDLLCMTCRRYKNNTENPRWFPVTYNLVNEVGNFVSYFKNRENEGLENYWIIKPYNLARSMDIHITNNINYIMRLPATGPKIVQKYLTNPVLFYRDECDGKVKFDVRYVILLKSVCPLEVYVCKNFYLRFANKPFSLDNFDDYEKHFTVMNYTENALKHLKCDEFKVEWEKQYCNFSWGDVEEKILKMIKEIVECATLAEPPCGLAESPQSRALYAADLMLNWEDNEIQPKILEFNFMPDCERACKYYPDFFNDIFKLLFLNEENSDVFFKL